MNLALAVLVENEFGTPLLGREFTATFPQGHPSGPACFHAPQALVLDAS